MSKFLAIYLLVTGAMALVALAVPSLVILGFFLLVIPGLILSLAPTAFLWGCIFAATWWLCRSVMGDMLAIAPALAITAAVLIAIPAGPRGGGQRLFQASLLPDLAPAAPIAFAGDIRVELSRPRWDNKNREPSGRPRTFSCDNLCIGLLFTPGVTSVTVNSTEKFSPAEHREGGGPLAEGARTFRLVPRAQCGDRAVAPDLQGRVGLFGKTLEENRRIAAEWDLKLANEVCLVAEPPLTRFDVQVRQSSYRLPEGAERFVPRWSLRHGPAEIDQVEIRDGTGKLLLRKLISRVAVPARPLNIAASGAIESFHFHWGRETLSNARRYAEVGLDKILQADTNIAGRSASNDLLPQIRAGLKDAVADKMAPADDRRFGTIEAYFEAIGREPLSEEDLALATALILDHRIAEYRGLWHLKGIAPDQHRQLGGAMLLRLLGAQDPLSLRRAHFSAFLANSPPGALANLSDDEQALLAAPDRRIAASGLVSRLSDGGAVQVPLLLEIMRYHAIAWKEVREGRKPSPERSSVVEGHSGMVTGARMALCRLGPAAAHALPQIEAMMAQGIIPPGMAKGSSGTDWNLMLLRLGKPLDQIRKPESIGGSEDNYRRSMANRLQRFDPERSCGQI